MKKHIALLTLLLPLAFAAAAQDVRGPVAGACARSAQSVLDGLVDGDYARAGADFDEAMRKALPATQLEQVWQGVMLKQMGAFLRAMQANVERSGAHTVATLPLEFADAWAEMRVTCTDAGEVTGLYFKPIPAPADAEAAEDGGHALDVTSPLGPLPGRLVLPRSGQPPWPAVLLVAGSGPNDMDETIGPNKPFRDLAIGLAERGIASLRYDKRTRIYGSQMAGQNIGIDDEVTDDAVAAAQLLAKQPGINPDKVFVLGHSLGGLMAPRIGQRNPELAGLIMLAAPTELGPELVIRQTRYLAAVQNLDNDQTRKLIAPLRAMQKTLANADPDKPPEGLFFNAPASYWFSLRDYDAVATARSLPLPMLFVQGEADYQVTMKDEFEHWEKALADKSGVTFASFPGLSHIFMPAGKLPSPADYDQAGHVDPAVIDRMADWIKAR